MMMVDRRTREDEEDLHQTHYYEAGDEEDFYEEEVIEDDTEGDDEQILLNDRNRGDERAPHDAVDVNDEVSFDEETVLEEEYDEEELVEDDEDEGDEEEEDDDDEDDDDEDEEIVELSEDELLANSDDDDDDEDDEDDFGDESMSGSGQQYYDDSSAPPPSVDSESQIYYQDDMNSINILDDVTATSASPRDSKKKRQMDMHNSAISTGARKALMEEIAREQSIQERAARREVMRLRLEQETERLKSSARITDDRLNGTDSEPYGRGQEVETEEEVLQRLKERDQSARQRLIEEIEKVDLALSKRRKAVAAATRTLSATDIERNNRALAELRRQVAREELARNNNQIKAAQASNRLSESSVVSLQSSIRSLCSPPVSPAPMVRQSLSKTPTGNPSLASIIDGHCSSPTSSNAQRDSQAKYGDIGNESATLISQLPDEPPFFQGGSTGQMNSKIAVESRKIDASQGMYTTHQSEQNQTNQIEKHVDSSSQLWEEREMTYHSHFDSPRVIVSPASQSRHKTVFKLDAQAKNRLSGSSIVSQESTIRSLGSPSVSPSPLKKASVKSSLAGLLDCHQTGSQSRNVGQNSQSTFRDTGNESATLISELPDGPPFLRQGQEEHSGGSKSVNKSPTNTKASVGSRITNASSATDSNESHGMHTTHQSEQKLLNQSTKHTDSDNQVEEKTHYSHFDSPRVIISPSSQSRHKTFFKLDAQAKNRLSGSSIVSQESTIRSLGSPSFSPSPLKKASVKSSLAGLLDHHQTGSLSSNVGQNNQATFRDTGNESATLISELPDEPPFLRQGQEDHSGGSKSINKSPTNAKTSVGSKITNASSATDSNESHGMHTTHQSEQMRTNQIEKHADSSSQLWEEREMTHHSHFDSPRVIISPSSQSRHKTLFKLDAQAKNRLSGSSIVSQESTIRSLGSPSVSPSPLKKASVKSSLAGLLDCHQTSSLSNHVGQNSQATFRDNGNESATLISELPDEPPFLRQRQEEHSGGSKAVNKSPTSAKTSVGSKISNASSVTDSNESHGMHTTHQSEQKLLNQVTKHTDSDNQVEEKTHHSHFDNPKVIISPSSRSRQNPFIKLDASGRASIPDAFLCSPRSVPRSSRDSSTKASQTKDRPRVEISKADNPVAKQGNGNVPFIAKDKNKSPSSTGDLKSDTREQHLSKAAGHERKYYPLIDLQQGKVDGIDLTRREEYLSPNEFEKLFKMSKEAFSTLPKWKRDKTKRSLKLF